MTKLRRTLVTGTLIAAKKCELRSRVNIMVRNLVTSCTEQGTSLETYNVLHTNVTRLYYHRLGISSPTPEVEAAYADLISHVIQTCATKNTTFPEAVTLNGTKQI